MKVFYRGVGCCRVHEVLEVPAVPRVDDVVDWGDQGKDEHEEWSVRTVVWTPREPSYDAYVVIGEPRR